MPTAPIAGSEWSTVLAAYEDVASFNRRDWSDFLADCDDDRAGFVAEVADLSLATRPRASRTRGTRRTK